METTFFENINAVESMEENIFGNNINILSSKKDDFIEVVKKYNRKAEKLGMDPVVYSIGKEYVKETKNHGNVSLFPVTIESYSILKIDGWRFIATIETVSSKDETPINDIKSHTANINLSNLRNVQLTCEHCNINRFRKHHYVLFNEETNKTKIVGSTCIKDFLGINPNNAMHSFAFFDIEQEYFFNEEKEDSYTINLNKSVDIFTVIEKTMTVLRNNDFQFIKKNMEVNGFYSTSTIVSDELFNDNPKYKPYKVEGIDTENAMLVYNLWKSIHEKINNDIENMRSYSDIDYKIFIVMEKGFVSMYDNNLGFIVGFAYGNLKNIQKEKENETMKDLEGGFFGTIKKREEFNLTIKSTKLIDTMYGVSTVINGVLEGTAKKFVWFASGDKKDMFQIDNTYFVKATVKDQKIHDTFGEQTILTRVTIIK